MTPKKLGTVLVTALVCVAPLSCKRPSSAEPENRPAISTRHDGNEWLAWPDNERVHFVAAYIDGYDGGVHNACAAVDHTLDLKANHSYDHTKDEIVLPSGVCWKGADHYSKFKPNPVGDPDVSAYTEVLTRFYTEHAEYKNIPYEYLMPYLTDEQYKTADDLYKMAKAGDMRTHW